MEYSICELDGRGVHALPAMVESTQTALQQERCRCPRSTEYLSVKCGIRGRYNLGAPSRIRMLFVYWQLRRSTEYLRLVVGLAPFLPRKLQSTCSKVASKLHQSADALLHVSVPTTNTPRSLAHGGLP